MDTISHQIWTPIGAVNDAKRLPVRKSYRIQHYSLLNGSRCEQNQRISSSSPIDPQQFCASDVCPPHKMCGCVLQVGCRVSLDDLSFCDTRAHIASPARLYPAVRRFSHFCYLYPFAHLLRVRFDDEGLLQCMSKLRFLFTNCRKLVPTILRQKID